MNKSPTIGVYVSDNTLELMIRPRKGPVVTFPTSERLIEREIPMRHADSPLRLEVVYINPYGWLGTPNQ